MGSDVVYDKCPVPFGGPFFLWLPYYFGVLKGNLIYRNSHIICICIYTYYGSYLLHCVAVDVGFRDFQGFCSAALELFVSELACPQGHVLNCYMTSVYTHTYIRI